MNSISKIVLKNRIFFLVIAILIGLFFGMHLNNAIVSYLHQNYEFNETINSIIGFVANIAIIIFCCYAYLKFLIFPAERKVKHEYLEKVNDKIKLKTRITDLSKKEVEQLLLEYLKSTQPNKLKFKPKLIDFNNDTVKFGMKKHNGIFSIDSKKIYTS